LLAALLYATWVEHVLNELITVAVSRKGEPDALARRIIRDVQLSAKLDWLLPLLGFRPIGQKHAERLRKLAEFRNQYAHYKWPYIDVDNGEPSSKAVSTFLIDCRPTLAFLARYSSSQLLGVRAKLRRAVAPADP
jgi:hypothetical protein